MEVAKKEDNDMDQSAATLKRKSAAHDISRNNDDVIVRGCDVPRGIACVDDPIYVPRDNVVSEKQLPSWNFNGVPRPFLQRWNDKVLGVGSSDTDNEHASTRTDAEGHDQFIVTVRGIIESASKTSRQKEQNEFSTPTKENDPPNKTVQSMSKQARTKGREMSSILKSFARNGLNIGL